MSMKINLKVEYCGKLVLTIYLEWNTMAISPRKEVPKLEDKPNILHMRLTPKQARLISGLTQQDLAVKTGVHRHTIMKWERDPDTMMVGQAKMFAKAVGRGVDEIDFF